MEKNKGSLPLIITYWNPGIPGRTCEPRYQSHNIYARGIALKLEIPFLPPAYIRLYNTKTRGGYFGISTEADYPTPEHAKGLPIIGIPPYWQQAHLTIIRCENRIIIARHGPPQQPAALLKEFELPAGREHPYRLARYLPLRLPGAC